jgi:hypothetical protein
VARGEYKITKDVGSFDGHFANRFRRKYAVKYGRGISFRKMFGFLFGKSGIKVPQEKP